MEFQLVDVLDLAVHRLGLDLSGPGTEVLPGGRISEVPVDGVEQLMVLAGDQVTVVDAQVGEPFADPDTGRLPALLGGGQVVLRGPVPGGYRLCTTTHGPDDVASIGTRGEADGYGHLRAPPQRSKRSAAPVSMIILMPRCVVKDLRVTITQTPATLQAGKSRPALDQQHQPESGVELSPVRQHQESTNGQPGGLRTATGPRVPRLRTGTALRSGSAGP